jgi:uncharacterized protein (TIGR00725 family)
MGSGTERHDALALPLGRWIAERGFHLLTGGGGGVMEAVSEGFASVATRSGLVIGVLKGFLGTDGRVVVATPNPYVEVPIRTHLPLSGAGARIRSRNHQRAERDLIIGLPGEDGTRSEMELAMRYGRPAIAFLGTAPLPAGWPAVPLAATIDDVERLALPRLDAARG